MVKGYFCRESKGEKSMTQKNKGHKFQIVDSEGYEITEVDEYFRGVMERSQELAEVARFVRNELLSTHFPGCIKLIRKLDKALG